VAHRPWDHLKNANPALQQTISTGLSMVAAMGNVDLVHSHTWYANMAAHLTSLLYGIPHVLTMHSLEPLRPWKAEQLGGGDALSSWCERATSWRVNRPGMSGDSNSWEGWSHVRWFIEEVPAEAA
jgi:starch synthase